MTQRLGDVRTDRFGLAVIDGLAGIPDELFGDRDGDALLSYNHLIRVTDKVAAQWRSRFFRLQVGDDVIDQCVCGFGTDRSGP